MKLSIALLCFLFSIPAISQHDHHVYSWDKTKDGIILGTSIAGWGLAQYLKQSADKITIDDLPLRDPENLWDIDKGAINNYSKSADMWSDVILYTSFALPFSHYTGKICRDQGFVIGGMALEAFFITDGITNITKALTKRFRPFTYNPEVPIEDKLVSGARLSFMSGHASNTAALGWFTAKVYSDLYPDSKWKPVIWTLGITLPAATSYLRHKAGKHFPTDVIAGYIVGASVGYLVPHFHKNKNKDSSLQVWPNAQGVSLMYRRTLK